MNHLGGNNSATVGGGDGINSGIDFGNGATRDLDNKPHHHLGDLQIDAQDKAFKRGIQTAPDGKFQLFESILKKIWKESNVMKSNWLVV